MKDVFLTYSDMICPLGHNVKQVFENVLNKKSGIRKDKDGTYVAAFTHEEQEQLFGHRFSAEQPGASTMLLFQLERFVNEHLLDLKNPRTLLIICSTKGDIEEFPTYSSTPLLSLAQKIIKRFSPIHVPFIISNACISGLHGLIHGQRLIVNDLYDQVIVMGVDTASDFVRKGFSTLSAISDAPCRPFDASRKGLNLGEGVAIAVLENNPNGSFPVKIVDGCLTNDANHITGPSRDGAGLYRAITHIMEGAAGLLNEKNAFISPHGTATLYNDEMESIAFSNAGLSSLPMIGYKGYFGHTLGTSGLLETIVGLETFHSGIMPVSYGYEEQGVSREINMLKNSGSVKDGNQFNYFIKTGSGFGGCNAAVLFNK